MRTSAPRWTSLRIIVVSRVGRAHNYTMATGEDPRYRLPSRARRADRSAALRVRRGMRAVICVALALCASVTADAQTSAVIDEGTLMISTGGVPVGRESFRIVRAPGPGGQVFRAQSQSAIGVRRITTTLSTDSLGAPVSYDATTLERGETVERLRGRGRPDRFSALVQNSRAESSREYLVQPGTILLDDDVFHHFHFVAAAVIDSIVTVIVPRAARTERLRLVRHGPVALPIGDRTITATRLALVDSAGGRREFWLDPRGRLLRVSIPAQGIVAVRDDPPR